jgi:hypothetical protein
MPNADYANALLADLLGQTHGKTVNRTLARRISNHSGNAAQPRRRRRDVHDHAAAATIPRRHAPYRRARAVDGGVDVGEKQVVQRLWRVVFDRYDRTPDPGVVDKCRHAAEVPVGFGEQVLDLR